ncbi:DUF3243 domain-containing protein [Metabacillus idriensis]|uniref:DUF3243 family protein n=1 Tax=Metabacillus idriensis TaxID=324768 RepID=A0A6I2MCX4_9BACI|nr:DUF3243 family protein [Metabacillus idriensis]MCM3596143.1 DUF3243 domain-containing protein [Metabacillus idriensis]MRX56118.1 DUF3243 family protein [Metabacillus idriensis]OHR69534.1 hypothetical protein HMPREF3291_00440 [Bacillus sp. HMSC76G11]
MSEQNHIINKNESLETEKVESRIATIPDEKMEDILSSFESFKQYLGKRVALGEKLGLSEEQLAKTAEKVAAYLAENEEPRNREEKLLQELWKAGEKEQRHQLAHLLVRLVGKE